MGKLHISIDDTKWVFRSLTLQKPKSIFEVETFKFLQNLHKQYGSSFVFYCTYMGNKFRLSATPDIYRQEFIENNWINFGFHTYDQRIDYGNENDLQIGRHYLDTVSEIKRITGCSEYNDIVRVHKFQGGKQAVTDLKNLGVCSLLTADDDRHSYYLSSEDEHQLHKYGKYKDSDIGVTFFRTLPRIEFSPDILSFVKEKEMSGWELLPVFTHEPCLQQEEIKQRLEELCKWAKKS